MLPTPEDIFAIAKRCPTVAACVQSWRAGMCSWEQCLIIAVMRLTITNDFLREKVLKDDATRPMQILIERPKVPIPGIN